jgi:hypothetical protein
VHLADCEPQRYGEGISELVGDLRQGIGTEWDAPDALARFERSERSSAPGHSPMTHTIDASSAVGTKATTDNDRANWRAIDQPGRFGHRYQRRDVSGRDRCLRWPAAKEPVSEGTLRRSVAGAMSSEKGRSGT